MSRTELTKRIATLEERRETPFARSIREHPEFQALVARFEELCGCPLGSFLQKARLSRYAVPISDEMADLLGDMIWFTTEAGGTRVVVGLN